MVEKNSLESYHFKLLLWQKNVISLDKFDQFVICIRMMLILIKSRNGIQLAKFPLVIKLRKANRIKNTSRYFHNKSQFTQIFS